MIEPEGSISSGMLSSGFLSKTAQGKGLSVDTINIMLVDDHPALRFGVKALLEASGGMSVVAEASDGSSALSILAKKLAAPDIMLLDVQLPGKDGLSLIPSFLEVSPGLRIVILSAFDDEESVIRAMTAGAYGFIPKSDASQRIVDVVRRVYRGEKILNDAQTSQVIEKLAGFQAKEVQNRYGITPREVELLRHLSKGLSNQEIADALYISVSTAKRMMDTVVVKLGASNKTQAVVEALKLNII